MEKTREIFIRVEKSDAIINILKEIKDKEKEINHLFETYDKLDMQENKIFESWGSNLDDIIIKLDHITL